MKKKAIIFDVDGLLVDTERYYTKTWQQALAKYGHQISDEEVKKFSGYNWRIIHGRLSERYDEQLADQVVAERERLLKEHIEAGDIEAKPYAKEILMWAKEKGYRLVIASSGKKARAKKIVELLGLMPFFEYCVFGDDVKRNKPYPDPYLKALQYLDLSSKNQAIAVEDSLVGALAATRAGLDVVVIPDQSIRVGNYGSDQLKDISVFATGTDLQILRDVL